MRPNFGILTTLLVTFALVQQAWSGACPDDIAKALKPKPSGIWAVTAANNPQGSPPDLQYKFVRNTEIPVQAFRTLVYVGRPLSGHDEEIKGALAIKFGTPLKRNEQSAKNILLRRSPYISRCRPWYDIDFFWLPFALGVEETIDQYARYHVTNNNTSSIIQKFHVWYDSKNDRCVRTDSTKGNRRTAFLSNYEGEALSSGRETLAWLTAQSTAYAGETPAHYKSKVGKEIVKERDHLKKFSHVETQIVTYPLTGRICATFVPSNQEPDTSLKIEVTDLDIGTSGRRLGTWTLKWR